MKKLLLILLISISNVAYSHCDCLIPTAQKEIGVRENGTNNDGVRIREYLKAAKIYKPAPFCAAFLVWVFNECNIPHSMTAWSPSVTAKNRIYDRRYPKNNTTPIKSGDVATLYYKNLGRIGHALIIEKVNPDKNYYTTIEGNTNPQGSRETATGKDGVFRRKRLKSSIYQISRHCK